MDKLNCIRKYIESTKAYYLFMMGNIYNVSEWKNFILNNEYLIGAKVSFIANLMLGIKEDIVDNKGSLVYESKLFINSLELAVDQIANKNGNNYIIDGFIFPDAPTVVAIIRNKLAHGKYEIDFLHNNVIIQHKGIDIKIDIDKFLLFVIIGFRNMLKEQKTYEYTREISSFKFKEVNRKSKMTVDSDMRNVIKKVHLITFNLNGNGKEIDRYSIQLLEQLIAICRVSLEDAMRSDMYKNVCKHFKRMGYKFTIKSKSLNNNGSVNKVLEIFKKQNENLDLDYEEQIKLIAEEVQKILNNKYSNFQPIAANVEHLILLQAITKTNSTDKDVLSKHFNDFEIGKLKMSYDEFGVSLISIFNSLFIYPFEDIFVDSGGYKVNRSNEFDFSLLDVSMLKPDKITISYAPRDSAYEKYISLLKKKTEINDKIDTQKINLSKVNGNQKVISAITNNIVSLENLNNLIGSNLLTAKLEYDMINDDFNNNSAYFKNKAIVEGVRNSIAHGNYRIVGSGNIMNSVIIFEDIYNDELTFKIEVKFYDFIEFLENNLGKVMSYVSNQKNIKKRC